MRILVSLTPHFSEVDAARARADFPLHFRRGEGQGEGSGSATLFVSLRIDARKVGPQHVWRNYPKRKPRIRSLHVVRASDKLKQRRDRWARVIPKNSERVSCFGAAHVIPPPESRVCPACRTA